MSDPPVSACSEECVPVCKMGENSRRTSRSTESSSSSSARARTSSSLNTGVLRGGTREGPRQHKRMTGKIKPFSVLFHEGNDDGVARTKDSARDE